MNIVDQLKKMIGIQTSSPTELKPGEKEVILSSGKTAIVDSVTGNFIRFKEK